MAEKHGQSTMNIFVAFTTGDDCYEADLAKRSPKSAMKNGIQLSIGIS